MGEALELLLLSRCDAGPLRDSTTVEVPCVAATPLCFVVQPTRKLPGWQPEPTELQPGGWWHSIQTATSAAAATTARSPIALNTSTTAPETNSEKQHN